MYTVEDDLPQGVKYDSDKTRYGLVPPHTLKEVADVLTFGAKKYSPDNWKRVDDAHARYFDAAQRHIWAYRMGEVDDPESGFSHLSHAICCLMFLNELEYENTNGEVNNENQ